MSRKVVMEINDTKDINDIINNISTDSSKIILELDLKDNSDNYRYLCTSDKIKNWKFKDEVLTDNIISIDTDIKDVDLIEQLATKILSSKEIKNIVDNIVLLIDSFIEFKKTYKNIKFIDDIHSIDTTNLINIYKSKDIESAVYFGDDYSKINRCKGIISNNKIFMMDFLYRIKDNWGLLNTINSRSEIINILYIFTNY